MRPVVRKGVRIGIREFGPNDVDALHSVYGDAETTRHLSFEPRSRDDVALLLKRLALDPSVESRTEYSLAVEEIGTAAVTGLAVTEGPVIGIARLALGEHSSAQVGIALRRDRWGSGLGGEVLELMLAFGFDDLLLHRIWGARAPDNAASERLMMAAGMQPEGRIRDHVYVRGAWRDSLVYAILETEWRERHSVS